MSVWPFAWSWGAAGGKTSITISSVILSFWETELEGFNPQEAFSYRS